MGILAMAGAAGGLGQGAVEVGQQGQKMDLLTKQNTLAQMRETAIENLRNEHETERLNTELTARGNIAHAGLEESKRQFGLKQLQAAGLAEKAQAAHHEDVKTAGEFSVKAASARGREAAEIHTDAPGKVVPELTTMAPKTIKGHIDPVSHKIVPDSQLSVSKDREGGLWVQDPTTQRYHRFNKDSPTYGVPANGSMNRGSPQQAAAYQDLLADPLGKTSSGTPKSVVFTKAFPGAGVGQEYFDAVSKARAQRGAPAPAAPPAGAPPTSSTTAIPQSQEPAMLEANYQPAPAGDIETLAPPTG